MKKPNKKFIRDMLFGFTKGVIQSQFKENDYLVIDDNSEIIKPYFSKMEALGRVQDSSTGKIEKRYWTTNLIGVTKNNKHPIPMYTHLCSSSEKDLIIKNEETYKCLRQVHTILKVKSTFIVSK